MWSSRVVRGEAGGHDGRSKRPGLLRAGALGLMLALPLVLAGCSGLRPVYGDSPAFARAAMDFRYSEPQSRLDQIVIQELALRLGRNDSPASPLIRIVSRSSSRDLTRVRVSRPVANYEAVVSVTYWVMNGDQVVATGTREASASYTSGHQGLANDAARRDADGRAAREAANMVRLAILGHLGTPTRPATLPR